MNIAIIYSPNWANYIKIELHSLFKNNDVPIKAYLISDTSGSFDATHILNKYDNKHSIEFIDAEPLYNKYITSQINVNSRFTKYALYRLLLPELIQDDRLLYLDADTLVNGDLIDFYNIDMGKHIIAGAIDIGADHYNLKKPLGLKLNDIYINAGVMLMDIKKIRDLKLQSKWVHEANTRHYPAHDQCIINKTVKGKILTVSNIYNCSISTGLNIPRNEIVISHYAGALKAWDDGSVPNARLWFDATRDYKRVFGRK